MLQHYLAAISRKLLTGDATEHTYRGDLQSLLEEVSGSKVQAINEPKRSAAGAPDYILKRGVIPVGWIEAKDIGKNLAEVDQIKNINLF